MSNFCITYVSDKKYWKHLYVSIKSLVRNNKKKNIYIFHSDIKEHHIKEKFYALNKKIKFIKIESKDIDILKVKRKIMFYRYYIPQQLSRYSKILYLDSDTIIKGNIDRIFNINLKNYPIGIVKEPLQPSFKELHIGNNYKDRFNTGVILFNVKVWTKRQLTKKAINLFVKTIKSYRENINLLTDQPIINVLLFKNVKFIDKKWNFLDSFPNYGLKTAKILHFNRHKPWLINDKSPHKKRYNSYRRNLEKIIIPDDLLNMRRFLKFLKNLFFKYKI